MGRGLHTPLAKGRCGSGAHPGPSEWLETHSRVFLLQAWEVVLLGIMSSLVSVFQERDKSRERGTSLLFVLRTQGTWYPQGGKALRWSANRFQKTRLEGKKEAGSFWVFI